MSSKAQKVYKSATLQSAATLPAHLLKVSERKSDEQLSTLAGSAYFNLFALIPTITFLATISKQLGLTGVPREFTYPAIILLPILNLTKDGCAYFIALRNYHPATGKIRAELYLLPLKLTPGWS